MEKNRSPLVKITGNENTQKKAKASKGKNPKKKRTMNYRPSKMSY